MSIRKMMILAAAIGLIVAAAACDKQGGPLSPSTNTNGHAASEAPKTESPKASLPPETPETPDTDQPDPDQPDPDAGYAVLARNLQIPWSIAFGTDAIYLSEREGHIVAISGEKLTRQSVQLNKKVNHEGEGGFLGFILAPDFAETRLAFAYHTYKEQGETLNRVVLLKQEGEGWSEQKALLEGIPGDLYHNGGRLAIGPDNLLYITTGDAQNRALAQQKSSLAGKILRMTPDGQVPEDNPFPGSYVYSYGHRNPQGLDWNAEGQLYSTKHGPSGNPGGHDEINRIAAGSNYGWPSIIGDAKREGMTSPVYHTGETAIAPSGTVMDAEGRLLIAALAGEALYRFDPATGKLETLLDGIGRIRDVKLREGKLYLITNNTDGRGTPTETEDRLLVMNYRNE